MSLPPLIIRADGSSAIGAGHLMRTSSLAEQWLARGGDVWLLSIHESKPILNKFYSSTINHIAIEKPHPAPSDIQALTSCISAINSTPSGPPWVCVDGYAFDSSYFLSIRESGARLLIIDDNGHHNQCDANIILNQNIHADKREYINFKGIPLMGASYAQIRKEFEKYSAVNRKFPDKALNILVSMGGADTAQACPKILAALDKANTRNMTITVVAGPLNPSAIKIAKILDKASFASKYISTTDNMATLMMQSDIAIAAAGSTSLELAMAGLPTILITTANNQTGIARRFAELGCALDIGFIEDFSENKFLVAFNALSEDCNKRKTMSKAGQIQVDGLGAKRVSNVMRVLSGDRIVFDEAIREAEGIDSKNIFTLANDKEVRMNAFSQKAISWDDHEIWYIKKLASPNTRIYLLETEGSLIGQIRYDIVENNVAEIDISISPSCRGLSLGKHLLSATINRAYHSLNINSVRAIVKKDNRASIKTFLRAGFSIISDSCNDGTHCSIMEKELA